MNKVISSTILILFLFGCSEPNLIERQLTVKNRYVSNGYDNYDNEIFLNFKVEYNGWFWVFSGWERPIIPANGQRNWLFVFEEGMDSIYVHARFAYEESVEIKYVQADTVLRLDKDKELIFWNCGDSTNTAYPFPACFTGSN